MGKILPSLSVPPLPRTSTAHPKDPLPSRAARAYPHHALDIPSCLGERAYSWDSASFGSS